MRFNPPPSWPPVPSGWTPGPNWQPDPSWGPAPAGWPFWVDDTAPPQDPNQNPYPPPYPIPQPAKPRNTSRFVLAAILAVAVLLGGSIWYFGGSHGASAGTSASGAAKSSKKHDITTLSKDLLLDRSQFSGFDGDDNGWESRMIDTNAEDSAPDAKRSTTNPQECARLGRGLPTGRQVGSSVQGRTKSSPLLHTAASLALTDDKVDPKSLVEMCQNYTSTSTLTLGRGTTDVTSPWHAQALELDGLPKWAAAYTLEPELEPGRSSSVKVLQIEGYYRGVLVVAGYQALGLESSDLPDVSDKLAQLFNAQVAKLEAAP